MPFLGQNEHVEPMLAQPRASLPRGDMWSYEFKWDGIRALVDIRDGQLRITTRNGNDVTVAYPELQFMATLRADALIDGEIVAFDGAVPSFTRLQLRMHLRDRQQIAELVPSVPVHFIAFDLLRLDGVDLTAQPLSQRRELLNALAKLSDAQLMPCSVSPVFDDGDSTLQVAQSQGLEGVVAKLTSSRYTPGKRGGDWIKVKLSKHAELVVIGWEAATQFPDRLTSLVLGYYGPSGMTTENTEPENTEPENTEPENGGRERMHLAGKVSSGLDEATARRLRDVLVVSPHPFDAGFRSPGRIVTWVEPTVVVEVSYTEWAADGRLRHPVLLGIRTDKQPQQVRKEVLYGQ
jgi:bifunctional non-homologous end joining protein LigD